MVTTKVKQIKSQASLKRVINYATDESKTLKVVEHANQEFEVVYEGGQLQEKLVSGHLVVDEVLAYEEMMMTNKEANRYHGRETKSDRKEGVEVYAHHIIQSFSPDDNLTPEQVHEIGRRTALELTGGHHEFIIATHMDKNHLHNHIIFNATNSSNLYKFRWQKGTKKSLEKISDRHAEVYGAKIISDKDKIFDHTKYQAYRRQHVHKREIKSRLDFLLKHSMNPEDFLAKARALDLQVDFSGKYATYRLLDHDQQKVTRERSLRPQNRYSKEAIAKRIAINQVGHSLEQIRAAYDKEQDKKAQEFELRLPIKPWQVKQETETGIYLEVDYGLRNHGLVKIPYRMVDKLEDGSFELFIKSSDMFYFLNPDQSTKNRFITGDILVKQLAYHNGDYVLKKNPNVSKLDELIREFSFLNQHDVTNSDQFEELGQRFIAQLEETDKTLATLDEKLARVHKIRAALEDYHTGNQLEQEVALAVLEQYHIPLAYPRELIDKELMEIAIERTHLKETLDRITFDYKKMATIKDRHHEREDNELSK